MFDQYNMNSNQHKQHKPFYKQHLSSFQKLVVWTPLERLLNTTLIKKLRRFINMFNQSAFHFLTFWNYPLKRDCVSAKKMLVRSRLNVGCTYLQQPEIIQKHSSIYFGYQIILSTYSSPCVKILLFSSTFPDNCINYNFQKLLKQPTCII